MLAIQGDFAAHVQALEEAGADAVEVRKPAELDGLDGLILPGGESTTFLKFLERDGLLDSLQRFVAENRDSLSVTSDKLASVTTALNQSLDDIKQTLHITPTVFQNFINIYNPAQGTLTGALVVNNFANPISFLCGAVQAASRLGAEQSAKLLASLDPTAQSRTSC